jgi:polyisoprenoid-binding protein YceI
MKRAAFAGVASLFIAGAASAGEWKIDSSHSEIGFAVKHMMVSNTKGEFKKVTGGVTLDPKKPTEAKINVTIDIASINTDDEKRDGHLKGTDFFDVAKHPTATFVSKKITKGADKNKFKVLGDLTIRGVTKEVTLDTEITDVTSAWGKNIIGVHAETTINRIDYGVSWNQNLDKGGVVVGNDVKLTIDLELNEDTGKSS